jgi:hypothetical protein
MYAQQLAAAERNFLTVARIARSDDSEVKLTYVTVDNCISLPSLESDSGRSGLGMPKTHVPHGFLIGLSSRKFRSAVTEPSPSRPSRVPVRPLIGQDVTIGPYGKTSVGTAQG